MDGNTEQIDLHKLFNLPHVEFPIMQKTPREYIDNVINNTEYYNKHMIEAHIEQLQKRLMELNSMPDNTVDMDYILEQRYKCKQYYSDKIKHRYVRTPRIVAYNKFVITERKRFMECFDREYKITREIITQDKIIKPYRYYNDPS